MKRFNNFMDKAPYWQVWVFIFAIMFVSIYGFLYFIGSDDKAFRDIIAKLSTALSLLGSLLYLLMLTQMRKSQKFWERLEVVKVQVENAETKDAIIDCANLVDELRKMALGYPHYSEVNRLITILNIKSKYIK